MTKEAPTPEDEEWDWKAAREKLAPKHDGRKAARKDRQRRLTEAVDGRSLRSTGRTNHLNFKATDEVKALLGTIPRGIKSLWIEDAILAKARAEGLIVEAEGEPTDA